MLGKTKGNSPGLCKEGLGEHSRVRDFEDLQNPGMETLGPPKVFNWDKLVQAPVVDCLIYICCGFGPCHCKREKRKETKCKNTCCFRKYVPVSVTHLPSCFIRSAEH